jgi:predicted regulator of Ras-like GTPase activity (Roadblock/LC7/MglB family)
LQEIPNTQPEIAPLLGRCNQELGSQATILIHRDGQILAKTGDLPEDDFPALAALVAGMVSAGESLSSLIGEIDPGHAKQLNFGSSSRGIYAVSIKNSYWIAAAHGSLLNPGLYRMQIRRLAIEVERLLEKPSARAISAPARKSDPMLFNDITDEEINQLFDI